MSKFQRARGVYDRIPSPKDEELWKASHLWEYVIKKAKSLAKTYGFEEIVVPTFETTDLFCRSVGDGSDIVTKEMYTFQDRGQRSLTLRPELTAPVVRAYLENSLFQEPKQKFMYIGNCFRYDRHQLGRYREFHQFGVEAFDNRDPSLDVEIIDLVLTFLRSIGLSDLTLLLNTIGSSRARAKYSDELRSFFTPLKEKLSQDSQIRLEKNPMRILDSKDEGDQELVEKAPKLHDFLDEESITHFEKVKTSLDTLGISYQIDPKLVRGLDYYNDTVFEVISNTNREARQNSIAAGGRYDSLVKTLGGPETPAIGFSCGIERIIQALIAEGADLPERKPITLLFIPMNEDCKRECFALLKKARTLGIRSDLYRKNFNVKKALKYANDSSTPYVAIMGEEEYAKNEIVLKNLDKREETTYPWDGIFEQIQASFS